MMKYWNWLNEGDQSFIIYYAILSMRRYLVSFEISDNIWILFIYQEKLLPNYSWHFLFWVLTSWETNNA